MSGFTFKAPFLNRRRLRMSCSIARLLVAVQQEINRLIDDPETDTDKIAAQINLDEMLAKANPIRFKSPERMVLSDERGSMSVYVEKQDPDDPSPREMVSWTKKHATMDEVFAASFANDVVVKHCTQVVGVDKLPVGTRYTCTCANREYNLTLTVVDSGWAHDTNFTLTMDLYLIGWPSPSRSTAVVSRHLWLNH